ncbi:MAG: Methyltransferase type 12 [Verrucomicrobiaceae bacterium]|nr:Methyltransferase type 12 [Verrucomicrobiaceae bacterium]
MSSQPNATATNASFEFQALAEAVNYRRALMSEFGPFLRGSVLEVGAGIGQTTSQIAQLQAVTTLYGVEPDHDLAAEFRRQLPAIPLTEGTVADFSVPAVDAIISVNVLEHIEDDFAELQRYQRLLVSRAGCLCLFVPARQEIYAPLDRDFGHFRRYAKPALAALLAKAGYKVEHLHYFNFTGYFAWWLSFRLLGKRSFDARAVRFYDRVIFPLVHTMESKVCRPPIGQSLLAIARAIP